MRSQDASLPNAAGRLPHVDGRRVIVCSGTGCRANGSEAVYEAFCREVEATGLPVVMEFSAEKTHDGSVPVTRSGCQGICSQAPLVTILPDNILYMRVKPEDVAEIVGATLGEGKLVERLLYRRPDTDELCRGAKDIPFLNRQTHVVLREVGTLNPESLDEYIRHGGYAAARKAYTQMSPEEICAEISRSGLRGRGGGGFPTGRKWEAARQQPGPKKYVICNADEGDPGAFMNCSVMEGNPHSVIEGLMIAARAIGADEAYVYIRAEYPLAVRRMKRAVAEAREAGFLGNKVFDTEFNLHCELKEGAGAFVCGEETAMIASIEGERGMPRPKPPFPAQSGLWGKPTIINNVETLAQVVRIINDGADVFRKVGTQAAPGTKTFALTGHVANTGLIEVPFGTTLREVVFGIGGGVTDDAGNIDPDGFKAVQIGGPSGGCLTREHLDLPLDYDALRSVGAMVGSGGLVVMNRHTCMVSVARFFMDFTQRESCGKCVLCREGTKQMLSLLDDILEGRADETTLPLLQKLGAAVAKGSLCGLGKTAPNPVLSTLRYFRDEYEAHVFDKTCPAGRCPKLRKLRISAEKCKGCGACIRVCSVHAIRGEKKKPHQIDETLCIKCGACQAACKFDAVEVY
ncbi:MAG: 4Fe-4S binding protein [Phycisphaerae bacterium]|nr:4Fe-4S binding protein [Phycisphaerae bacterium]